MLKSVEAGGNCARNDFFSSIRYPKGMRRPSDDGAATRYVRRPAEEALCGNSEAALAM